MWAKRLGPTGVVSCVLVQCVVVPKRQSCFLFHRKGQHMRQPPCFLVSSCVLIQATHASSTSVCILFNFFWRGLPLLGPPVVPLYPFLGEGSPTKRDYRKKGTLILTSLLEDLVWVGGNTEHPESSSVPSGNPVSPPFGFSSGASPVKPLEDLFSSGRGKRQDGLQKKTCFFLLLFFWGRGKRQDGLLQTNNPTKKGVSSRKRAVRVKIKPCLFPIAPFRGPIFGPTAISSNKAID